MDLLYRERFLWIYKYNEVLIDLVDFTFVESVSFSR